MSFIHYSHAKAIMDLRVHGAVQRTEIDLLRRQVEAPQQRWLSRQGCWLLCQLGHSLVALGQWLERYGLPQTPSLEGRISSSS